MMHLGALGYLAAFAALLLLAVLLLTSWRGRRLGLRMIVAIVATAAWVAIAAWLSWSGISSPLALLTAELVRDGAWIWLLTGSARGLLPGLLTRGAHALWLVLLAAGLLLAWTPIGDRWQLGPAALLVPGGLAASLVILVLLEQIFRNANAAGRAAIKYLVIGMGVAFAYDLFLYSQALLLQGISPDLWAARGWINLLTVPILAVAARRNPDWSMDVFISRQVTLFTSATTAAGIYLLLMALGGYYIGRAGGSWGSMLNTVFFVGSLVVLAVVMASGSVRRQWRVFFTKHFYRNKFDYRVEWLRFAQTMSTGGGSDVRVAGLRAISQVFEVPGAVLYLRGSGNQHYWPTAAWPMAVADLPRLEPVVGDHDLVQFMERRQWVVDVVEYRRAPEFYQNATLPYWLLETDTYRLIVPLLLEDSLLGFALLMEPPPPFQPTFEDRDLLKTLGRHVATFIAQRESDRQLAEAQQFEAYHKLTAFMMHDLKNSVAQLQLIVSNADRHRRNPEFVDDAIGTVANTVQRMSRLIEQLRAGQQPVSKVHCALLATLRPVLDRCADRKPVPTLEASAGVDFRVAVNRDQLANAVEHVIRNAQDASREDDQINVAVTDQGPLVAVTVTDTGAGMSQEFVRERLFRPFDSTKGSKGMGIGAYQVREFLKSVGGKLEVQSSPGRGTRFQLMLPVAAEEA